MSDNGHAARSVVTGVLRMVAVIGLLSVVLGAGVHGVSGELVSTVPAAEFGYEYDGAAGTLEIAHEGGDALAAESVRVVGVEAACSSEGWSGRVTADDTCLLEDISREDTVRVVWDGNGPDRATLDVWVAGAE